MKIFQFLIIFILFAYPVTASCPIDGINNACAADMQNTLPELTPPNSSLISPASSNLFLGTPAAVKSEREIAPANNLRNFGATNQDYGYNSSCQFGVCMDTGTPKNFPSNNTR